MEKNAILAEISELLQQGNAKAVTSKVQEAMDSGIPAGEILNDGLMSGMGVIGELFKNNEVFIPEVLVSARAMTKGIAVLKSGLAEEGVESIGTAIIGTVKGDMHDIGKNLVKIMLEGRGINVIDLGVNVEPEAFIEAAKQNNASLICVSALLTTTMPEMKNIVRIAKEAGIRDDVYIMVGGAPLSQEYCDEIGADCFTPDASSAAAAAEAYIKAKRI